MKYTLFVRFAVLSVVMVASTLLGGCNIIAPALYITRGLPKVPAEHTLAKDRPTVIFVDDRASVLPRRTLRGNLASRAEMELLASKSLTNMIDAASIQNAAARDTSEKGLPIVTLAQSVKAEVVIYVSMDRFGLSQDGVTYQPYASARVKVIDAKAGDARVWPTEFEGKAVSVTMPVRQGDVPKTAVAQAKAMEDLAAELGSAVARLFYEHEGRESISKMRPE